MSFLAIFEGQKFDFSNFEPFLTAQIYKNSKLRVSEMVKWQFYHLRDYEIVKMKIFSIQIFPKLISCKIERQINSCILDLDFTFLEHSALKFFNFMRNQGQQNFGRKVNCKYLKGAAMFETVYLVKITKKF